MPRFHYYKSKKQADNFLRRVYREMATDDVFWRIMFDKKLPDNNCGMLDYHTNSVVFLLDPTSDSVISIFLHECLHYFYPEKRENSILCMEKELMYWLSARQLENIFIKMAELIWRKRI